jgi:ATP-dependent Clp protease protease subunit
MLNLPPELQAALLGRRMVFLRGRLDAANANSVIAQLLLVARTELRQTVDLYVDSPGGALDAALSVYDVVQTLGAAVSTTCVGTAGGAAVLVLAGGALGRRNALPHARVHLVDEPVDAQQGNLTDLAGHADEAARLRTRWRETLVRHSGHSVAQLERDLVLGRWLSAAEARDYGLVDGIIPGVPQTQT